ncbi:MAG: sensor histidine kinase, partial [Hyphomicrobiaceae bacterium]
ELLSTAKVRWVAIKQDGMRRLVLPPDGPITINQSYDLRPDPDAMAYQRVARGFGLIVDALQVLMRSEDRTIRVFGHPFTAPGKSFGRRDFVEIVLEEAPLRQAMLAFGLNILGLSIIISMIAAALVYFSLNRLLVQPMMRITRHMLRFSREPENASLIIEPSARTDEIGVAERELAHMQKELRSLLNQRSRLAALGLAVSKINHDLRNLLASAQLLSDRLGTVRDPTVQSFAPKLIASLDRAIAFCNDTLRYGRAEEAAPRRDVFRLADLSDEVAEGLGLPRAGLAFVKELDDGLMIDADRNQLYRVLDNLIRNASQVLDQQPGIGGEIRIRARREGRRVICEVCDNGPGVPEKAKANLFRPFHGGARKGGSGLGLTVAAELVVAHGGRLELLETNHGAAFLLEIPDRNISL